MTYIHEGYGHLRMGSAYSTHCVTSCTSPPTTPDSSNHFWNDRTGIVPYDGDEAAQKEHTPEVTYKEARRGIERTVRVGGQWSIGRVLMEPLFYNAPGRMVGSGSDR